MFALCEQCSKPAHWFKLLFSSVRHQCRKRRRNSNSMMSTLFRHISLHLHPKNETQKCRRCADSLCSTRSQPHHNWNSNSDKEDSKTSLLLCLFVFFRHLSRYLCWKQEDGRDTSMYFTPNLMMNSAAHMTTAPLRRAPRATSNELENCRGYGQAHRHPHRQHDLHERNWKFTKNINRHTVGAVQSLQLGSKKKKSGWIDISRSGQLVLDSPSSRRSTLMASRCCLESNTFTISQK